MLPENVMIAALIPAVFAGPADGIVRDDPERRRCQVDGSRHGAPFCSDARTRGATARGAELHANPARKVDARTPHVMRLGYRQCYDAPRP